MDSGNLNAVMFDCKPNPQVCSHSNGVASLAETHICDSGRILVISFVTGVTNTCLETQYATRDAIMQLL